MQATKAQSGIEVNPLKCECCGSGPVDDDSRLRYDIRIKWLKNKRQLISAYVCDKCWLLEDPANHNQGVVVKADFYFSKKQKRVMIQHNKSVKHIRVDGVWVEFTEQVKAGNELTSKWNDVILVAGNFDGDMRIGGVVQGGAVSPNK